MKGREGKGAPPTDLLVCFPSRAHLNLMPKSICSPARPTDSSVQRHNHHHHQHHVMRSNNRGGQASPLLWAKTKPTASEIAEPTSPKVTCAGQIKVRQKPGSSKNWESVMEEIERLHNNRKQKKRPGWVEAIGFKKEITQFLTCLRTIRFDFRCFGSVPGSDNMSDDEEDEDQENLVGMEGDNGNNRSSRTVFSKWFMVLQENHQESEYFSNKEYLQKRPDGSCDDHGSVAAPPSNALLLMRCRSAPAKSWLEEKEEEEANKAKLLIEEEEKKKKEKEKVVVMSYAPDFFGRVSSEIAKETWVVGGMKDPLSRSRSWKRW